MFYNVITTTYFVIAVPIIAMRLHVARTCPASCCWRRCCPRCHTVHSHRHVRIAHNIVVEPESNMLKIQRYIKMC